MSRKLFAAVAGVIIFFGVGLVAYLYVDGKAEYLQAYQPTDLLGSPQWLYPLEGDQGHRILKPMGLVVRRGNIYATSADGRVVVSDRQGSKYRDLVTMEDSPPPTAIVIDDEGRTYISSAQGKDIRVFDSEGEPTDEGRPRQSKLKVPVGLGYHQGHLYVTDVGDHKVKIFSAGGELVKEFGGFGSRVGKFAYPNGVAVAPDGRIYVADSNNGRVQVFDRDCQFVETLPQPTAEKDKVLMPRAMAFDRLGRVHVLDTLRGLVHVYGPGHKYLFNYGQGEVAGARLRYPNAISIDAETGLIFIADRQNNRVAVWGAEPKPR